MRMGECATFCEPRGSMTKSRESLAVRCLKPSSTPCRKWSHAQRLNVGKLQVVPVGCGSRSCRLCETGPPAGPRDRQSSPCVASGGFLEGTHSEIRASGAGRRLTGDTSKQERPVNRLGALVIVHALRTRLTHCRTWSTPCSVGGRPPFVAGWYFNWIASNPFGASSPSSSRARCLYSQIRRLTPCDHTPSRIMISSHWSRLDATAQ